MFIKLKNVWHEIDEDVVLLGREACTLKCTGATVIKLFPTSETIPEGETTCTLCQHPLSDEVKLKLHQTQRNLF